MKRNLSRMLIIAGMVSRLMFRLRWRPLLTIPADGMRAGIARLSWLLGSSVRERDTSRTIDPSLYLLHTK